jgi:hypothetical protein
MPRLLLLLNVTLPEFLFFSPAILNSIFLRPLFGFENIVDPKFGFSNENCVSRSVHLLLRVSALYVLFFRFLDLLVLALILPITHSWCPFPQIFVAIVVVVVVAVSAQCFKGLSSLGFNVKAALDDFYPSAFLS